MSQQQNWELMLQTDIFKPLDHCVCCGKGTMELDKPCNNNQYYYCKCPECGYIDAAPMYTNLQHTAWINSEGRV